jgi:hypothetical protein
MVLLGLALLGFGLLMMAVAASTWGDNYGAYSPELAQVREYSWKVIKISSVIMLVGGTIFYYAVV